MLWVLVMADAKPEPMINVDYQTLLCHAFDAADGKRVTESRLSLTSQLAASPLQNSTSRLRIHHPEFGKTTPAPEHGSDSSQHDRECLPCR